MRAVLNTVISLLSAAVGAVIGFELIRRTAKPEPVVIDAVRELNPRQRHAAWVEEKNAERKEMGLPRLLHMSELPDDPLDYIDQLPGYDADGLTTYGQMLRIIKAFRPKRYVLVTLSLSITLIAGTVAVAFALNGETEVAAGIMLLSPALWSGAFLLSFFYSSPVSKWITRAVVVMFDIFAISGLAGAIGQAEFLLGLIGALFAVVLDILTPDDDRYEAFHREQERRRRENRESKAQEKIGATT